MKAIAVLVLPALVLAACSHNTLNGATTFDNTPRLDGAPIENVLTRVKQEVGLFYSDGAKSEANWGQHLRDLNVKPVCGNGHIAFEITSVKMDFNVTTDQTRKAGGGLKIPFGIPAANGSIEPGLNGSNETVGTIDLVYLYKPLANGPATDDYEIIRTNAVILPALDSLRDGLIKATGSRPCFHSLGPTDPDQTLTFSVAVTKDTSESLGFNFAILNMSASNENKNGGTNTITVSYRPISFTGGVHASQALHTKSNAR